MSPRFTSQNGNYGRLLVYEPGTCIVKYFNTTGSITLTNSHEYIQLLSGANQTASVNTSIPSPILVQVLDSFSAPVSGIYVSWTITGNGGTFISPTTLTDGSGQAAAALTDSDRASWKANKRLKWRL